ncbi:MAG: hypothetical protein IJU90_04485 [Bacteroidales bacterium]|nr:hypothetical protein [Bacteroidales bacterium]
MKMPHQKTLFCGKSQTPAAKEIKGGRNNPVAVPVCEKSALACIKPKAAK